MGVPKFPELGLSQVWGPITLCVNLWLRWGLKQSCSPCRELSNSVFHVTCTQGNWVDSRLLVGENQTANLTIGLSFGHNLCFRCPNGSCEPILDIYNSIIFQWPLQLRLKDLGIHWNSNSHNGSSFGSARVHSLAFFYIPGSMWCDFRASFLACNLAIPCLGHQPKARVATLAF